jgi:hypothetical protein
MKHILHELQLSTNYVSVSLGAKSCDVKKKTFCKRGETAVPKQETSFHMRCMH